jgi:hypothetical protein
MKGSCGLATFMMLLMNQGVKCCVASCAHFTPKELKLAAKPHYHTVCLCEFKSKTITFVTAEILNSILVKTE